MADTQLDATLGAKAAMKTEVGTVTLEVTVRLTKPYIWIMKCRYIWAVIRAKVNEQERDENGSN